MTSSARAEYGSNKDTKNIQALALFRKTNRLVFEITGDLAEEPPYQHGKTPGDVYNIASLIVSEFAYLNEFIEADPKLKQIFDPGYKIPSEVYQHAGMLESQLIEFKKHVF